jgi:hypothetical protein
MELVKKLGLSLVLVAIIGIGSAQPGRAGPNPCGDGSSDSDCDTVADAVDNCLTVPNSTVGEPPGSLVAQCDTDQDGYGNVCDPDINNDGVIGGPDYGPITASFGQAGHPTNPADVNCDGVVGGPDYGLVTQKFGGVPGPSGLFCAGTIPCP